MACDTKFEKGLDFECVKDIIADVRAGTASVDTVKKGLWVLGCGAEFFVPTVIGEEDSPKTLDELCNDLEGAMAIQGDDQPVQNPLVWITIAKMVWELIQQLRKR